MAVLAVPREPAYHLLFAEQLEEAGAVVSSNLSRSDEEIDRVFGKALGLIDSTLVVEYGIARADASELEQKLHDWFHLFSRRSGSGGPVAKLRFYLFLMACQAAHTYSAGKFWEDERVKRALELGPQEIAIELEKKLEEVEKREGQAKEPKKEES